MIYKYKEAIEDSKKSTLIDENFVKGYSREGKSHLILGDFKSALRCFQKIKQLEPDNKAVDVDVNNRTHLNYL